MESITAVSEYGNSQGRHADRSRKLADHSFIHTQKTDIMNWKLGQAKHSHSYTLVMGFLHKASPSRAHICPK